MSTIPWRPPQRAGAISRVAGAFAVGTDFARAPVVFGWLLYRQDHFAGAIHLEALYRLDRVGGSAAQGDAVLQPSVHHDQSTEMLRALVRAQQHTRLPPPPPGCHWLGPQLVTQVDVSSRPACLQEAPGAPVDALPAGRRARLDLARAIARRLLQSPEGA